jgi:hypothetical protein
MSSRIGIVLTDGRIIGIANDGGYGRTLRAAAELLLAGRPQEGTGTADDSSQGQQRKAET